MTLWLHIGLPKTGSSALQVFFSRNKQVLRRKALLYPWSGPARGGRATAGNARWLADHRGGYPSESERGAELARWLRRGRNVLLSSEEFAKADPETLEAVRDLAGDTRILAYVRDQAEMIVGRYLQLKGYGRLGPERTLRSFVTGGGGGEHLRFGAFLDGVAEIFGREQMTVLSYKQNKGRLAESALEALGLDAEGFDLQSPSVNKSPQLETPDPELIREIRSRYRDENERAVRDWFPGRSVEDIIGP